MQNRPYYGIGFQFFVIACVEMSSHRLRLEYKVEPQLRPVIGGKRISKIEYRKCSYFYTLREQWEGQ